MLVNELGQLRPNCRVHVRRVDNVGQGDEVDLKIEPMNFGYPVEYLLEIHRYELSGRALIDHPKRATRVDYQY